MPPDGEVFESDLFFFSGDFLGDKKLTFDEYVDLCFSSGFSPVKRLKISLFRGKASQLSNISERFGQFIQARSKKS